ncbi:uncharacterized protein LOC132194367 isoform X2 [Neocloeon triangulifer]|uniref:uncharacterized protein LOC132194367 isoform X2 n=1 Tax=Neocloeon triangulifer TaxID=2078957 RepID=UPI00286ED4B3|nr:uncharacterized protein LOC132194367 isoform X2 [Neocloeon triangulifer]
MPRIWRGPLKDAVWKPVLGAKNIFMVYSAYLESRALVDEIVEIKTPFIRIIGVGRLTTVKRRLTIDEKAYCLYWFDKSTAEEPLVVEAEFAPLLENWNLNFSACYILCPLNGSPNIPTSVSIYSKEVIQPFLINGDIELLADAGNKILIHTQSEDKNLKKSDMAVCVNPFYKQYSRAWDLVEWIEMNKILGFGHFYFYNHTLSNNVSCTLEEYMKEGTVIMHDWKNLPYILLKGEGNRVGNIFAAANDCLYRSMYYHKYVGFFDVDEFLVPAKNAHVLEIMDTSFKNDPKQAVSIFKNTFFFLEWPNDPKYKGLDLITQKKTKRLKIFDNPRARSKYITKPTLVTEVGSHFVWRTTDKQYVQNALNESDAYSRHYRICEFPEHVCKSHPTAAIDQGMWRFKIQLTKRMEEAQKKFGAKCNLAPIKKI